MLRTVIVALVLSLALFACKPASPHGKTYIAKSGCDYTLFYDAGGDLVPQATVTDGGALRAGDLEIIISQCAVVKNYSGIPVVE